MSTQVRALTSEESVRNYILHNYDKTRFPDEVELTYNIVYVACPIPDPDSGTLISEVNEMQVSLGIYHIYHIIYHIFV